MILLDMLHARAKRVVFAYISMVRRRACCAPAVMLREVKRRLQARLTDAPVGLVKNDNLMTAWWQRNLLLRESLDFVPDDIDTSARGLGGFSEDHSRSTHLSSDAFSSKTPSLYASPNS